MKIPLANENYDVRGKAGTFSAETEDAVDAAHRASAAAHEAGTQDAHERAARLHRLAAKRHADDGNADEAKLHDGIATGHDAMAAHCLANGDLPGHEFHGNQWEATEQALAASKKARAASLSAERSETNKADARAAHMHQQAYDLHSSAANAHAAKAAELREWAKNSPSEKAKNGFNETAEKYEQQAERHRQLAETHLAQVKFHQSEIKEPLANEFQFAIGNDAAIDDEGWALIAPFGRHPKTRVYQDGGLVKEQKFIQVLDNESADAMLGKENSFFGKLKRALIGIPVFKGHGDLKEHDPKALANEDKVKLGVIDQIRKRQPAAGHPGGIEAHFALDNDGAAAVADGWKLPSALWLVQPIGNEGESILARPFKLLSVALTKFPNISGVESLANQRDAGLHLSPAEPPGGKGAQSSGHQPNTEPDMKLIAGFLIANGVALANAENPTETQVLDALKTVLTSKAGEVTALGNEKQTLTGKITALENDVTAANKKATDAQTALANEQTARKAERKQAATMATDLAIQRGKKTIAEREATITALENSADFDKDAKALLDGKPVVKIAGQDVESGKALANERDNAQATYDREFKAALALCNQDPVKAHQAVLMKLPNIADALKVKKG